MTPDQEPILTADHLRLRRCRHGTMMYNLNDAFIGTMLDLYGEFSEGETDVFRQVLRPGMTAVEVGANIGAHTLSLAKFVGPNGRVVAFEPQRSVFQLLCGNLALNGIEHVEAIHAAVGSEPGSIAVPRLDSRARQNFGGLSLGRAQQGDRVRLLTLDGLHLAACHFLKIDVEGMESEVLSGATETIKRARPILYVENDRKEKSATLIRQLQDLDYRCYWHTPAYVRVPNFRGNSDNRFPRLISINMLCVPRRRDFPVTGLREVEA